MTAPHGPLFVKPRRRLLRLWGAFAVLNLVVGVVVSLQPERTSDLESVMGWGRAWLVHGVDAYAQPDVLVDYPPHAVVLLSPLSLLPFGAALPAWVAVNLALAFLAPYFAARFFQPHASFRTILLPVLMFASWWGTHTLTQFSLLALTLSMAAMAMANGVGGGILLGAALMKPQVAVPVFLWTLFARRWRTAATAVMAVAIGFAVFCLRAQVGPIAVVERYLGVLATYYTGDAIMTGASDLRPLLLAVSSSASEADWIAGMVALGLLAGICVMGVQEGRGGHTILYAAPALAACWSLLTFYHLSYGFIVLLPAMMLLAFNDTEQTPLRRAVFWTMQIGLMADIPGLVRRSGLQTASGFGAALLHADRLLILLIFAGLVAVAWKETHSSIATQEIRRSGG